MLRGTCSYTGSDASRWMMSYLIYALSAALVMARGLPARPRTAIRNPQFAIRRSQGDQARSTGPLADRYQETADNWDVCGWITIGPLQLTAKGHLTPAYQPLLL